MEPCFFKHFHIFVIVIVFGTGVSGKTKSEFTELHVEIVLSLRIIQKHGNVLMESV